MRTTTRRRHDRDGRRVHGEDAQLVIPAIVALMASFSVLVARGDILSASDSGVLPSATAADVEAPAAWVRPEAIGVLPPEPVNYGTDVDQILFESIPLRRPPAVSPPKISTGESTEGYLFLRRPAAVQVRPPAVDVTWKSLRESLSPTPPARPQPPHLRPVKGKIER